MANSPSRVIFHSAGPGCSPVTTKVSSSGSGSSREYSAGRATTGATSSTGSISRRIRDATCRCPGLPLRLLFLLGGALFHQALGGLLLAFLLSLHALAHDVTPQVPINCVAIYTGPALPC